MFFFYSMPDFYLAHFFCELSGDVLSLYFCISPLLLLLSRPQLLRSGAVNIGSPQHCLDPISDPSCRGIIWHHPSNSCQVCCNNLRDLPRFFLFFPLFFPFLFFGISKNLKFKVYFFNVFLSSLIFCQHKC